MANAFHSYGTSGVGTTPTTIYTASSKAVVIGLAVCNTYGATLPITITITKASGGTYNLVQSRRVDAGIYTDFMTGNKLVLETGDYIQAVSGAASSFDSFVSTLEGVS